MFIFVHVHVTKNKTKAISKHKNKKQVLCAIILRFCKQIKSQKDFTVG